MGLDQGVAILRRSAALQAAMLPVPVVLPSPAPCTPAVPKTGCQAYPSCPRLSRALPQLPLYPQLYPFSCRIHRQAFFGVSESCSFPIRQANA